MNGLVLSQDTKGDLGSEAEPGSVLVVTGVREPCRRLNSLRMHDAFLASLSGGS